MDIAVTILIRADLESKNPAVHEGFRNSGIVRRTGIEPVTLGFKALVLLGCYPCG